MKNVMIIGAGGVAWVAAHKCAQHNDIIGNICIASRSIAKCDAIIQSIHKKGNIKDSSKKLYSKQLDATDIDAAAKLIQQTESSIVLNLGTPWIDISVMQACIKTNAVYIDTAASVDLYSEGQLVPNAYDYQWQFKDDFKNAKLTAILGCGFDPGVVSAYAVYSLKNHFDKIRSIDILDVNAGSHGKKWATNFDPETNMLEIQGDSFYWQNKKWERVPCHTREMKYDFPLVGEHTLYSMAHDEVRSLAEFVDAQHIEFWMGFSENYLNFFNVLKEVGMLSPEPVTTVDGITVSPLKVLKAVLPAPVSLACNYTGKTCIGDLIKGIKDSKEKSIFIYNICDHKKCYEEVESQAISYTAGVPPVAAAMLIIKGDWDAKRLVNVEELDPVPFIELLNKIGLKTEIKEEAI